MLVGFTVHIDCAVVRRAAALRTPFPESILHAEDVIFFVLLRSQGRFLRIPEPLARYRRHGPQQSQEPSHMLRTATSRLAWFVANRDLFADGDEEVIRTTLVNRHLVDHEQAVREGDAMRAAEIATGLVEMAGPMRHLLPAPLVPPQPRRWWRW